MIDFTDTKFRPDLTSEIAKLTEALQEAKLTETALVNAIDSLEEVRSRVRGAASLVIRYNEQLTANRSYQLSILKELKAIKAGIADRELRIAEKESGMSPNGMTQVTAGLLSRLQALFLGPAGSQTILEPPPDDAGGSEFEVGDLISDPDGKIWTIELEGAVDTGSVVAELWLEGDDGDDIPFAVLEDGTRIPICEVSG